MSIVFGKSTVLFSAKMFISEKNKTKKKKNLVGTKQALLHEQFSYICQKTFEVFFRFYYFLFYYITHKKYNIEFQFILNTVYNRQK